MAEAAVGAVLGNVSTLAAQETTLLCGVTLEVEFLKDELKRLQGFLRDADNKRSRGNKSIVVLLSQIRDVAYEADNAIEAAEYMQKRNRLKKGFMGTIARYARLPSDLSTLHKVGVEIQRIKRKISGIFESANRLKIVDLGYTSTENVHVDDEFQQDYGPMHRNYEVVIVGFEDEYKEIVEKLVDTEKSLSAISIVAMGGAGKTALARKVYTSDGVKQHFGKIAWVIISQKYKGTDLLKDIMKQIMGSRDESVDKLNEYELGKRIHDFLLQTRYLELPKWQASTTKMLEASAALLQKARDTIGGQARRQERERADRDEVQDRLSHLVDHVATHVLRLRHAYRHASASMPGVGLNPFDHPVDFNELRHPDLVFFFTYISEELSRLHAMVGAELDKEGLRAVVAVAGRILSGLRHRNPFMPLDAVFDELTPVDRERALQAVAPYITNVVRLEKQRDFGGV